ncbi:MAG: hypothetical protein DDT34_02492 [Firmicutes bacterium]|nr:hypothetical protein [Bacillota bacterium]
MSQTVGMGVTVAVGTLGFVALFAVKGQKRQAGHVERRQKGGGDPHAVNEIIRHLLMAIEEQLAQDLILGEEARQRRDACDGQGTDEEGDPREGHVLLQAAHGADILGVLGGMGVLHGVDDATGA